MVQPPPPTTAHSKVQGRLRGSCQLPIRLWKAQSLNFDFYKRKKLSFGWRRVVLS